jgi:hypothetical protein
VKEDLIPCNSLINAEYEYIALNRDVGETELKQGREIRAGGNLVYVDSPAVRAVKNGRILILEGIEKAERGIMPVYIVIRSYWYLVRLNEVL